MLDFGFVRANLGEVRRRLESRGAEAAKLLDQFEEVDKSRREAIMTVEKLKAERNARTVEVQATIKAGLDPSHIASEVRALKTVMEALETNANRAEKQLRDLLLTIPNLPKDSAPRGSNESDNEEQVPRPDSEREARMPAKRFIPNPRPHWEIGEALGILDFERAAKISGSRFTIHFRQGAQLERALAQFMLDLHTREHGYTEVLPPTMVNSKSLFGTGQLPKFEEDLFYCVNKPDLTFDPEVLGNDPDYGKLMEERDRIRLALDGNDHWLIPTAEVPVTNIFRDETLDDADLPISFCAFTSCFRSEAGSYGKDVRGLIRQHQFQKVELVKFCRPQESEAEHEKLTRDAETVLERLGLPYRRMLLCTGDMGFSSAKTYDLEVWLPGQGLYREISSCSNFEGFQARRANIRYRAAGAKKPEFVHTLNGSGLAVGRTYLAILENYQMEDGSVQIPDVLVPYMNDRSVPEKDWVKTIGKQSGPWVAKGK